MNLAIIPARKGSKGIKDKNIRCIEGTPLLVHKIRAAQAAESVDQIVVTTDSREYASIAAKAAPEVIIINRPRHLATDEAKITDVITHVLEGIECGEFVLLQPTSPFVDSSDIDSAYELAYCAACSVYESPVHPERMRSLDSGGNLAPVVAGVQQRQQHSKAYVVNGGIYWVSTDVYMTFETLFPPNTKPYIMPIWRSIDIDTQEDLEYARRMYSRNRDQS